MRGVQESQPGGGNEPCVSGLVRPCDAYEVHSLRFRYQSTESSSSPWILDDVSFQVAQGEVVGIVGPNGSGKTSLLNLLARLASPQQGDITLFGRDLTVIGQDEIARIVGVVPQDTPQLFPFTVAETILMGRFPHRPRNRWGSGFGWESGEDMAIAGDADLFVAGGMESMSRAPYLVNGRSGELKFGNQSLTDALLNDGLWDPFENWGMGNAAEFIADEYEVTRAAMDEFALRSHLKAVEAQEAGRFNAEIVPVQIPGRKGEVTTVAHDEGPRKDTSLESLAKLKPVF